MPNQRIEEIVVQHVTDLDSANIRVGEYVLHPVEGTTIWHVCTNHSKSTFAGHVRPGTMHKHPRMDGAIPAVRAQATRVVA